MLLRGNNLNRLANYLEKYHDIQPRIQLCYREKNEGVGSGWSDRCFYLEEKYNRAKPYNHRMVLDKEVVIEFDEESLEANKQAAEAVKKRLKADRVKYSMWFSGSKSYHIHFFINPREATNLSLLKSAVMRHYCKGLEFKPDTQLAHSHLIRAEFGLNEKTGNYKVRTEQSVGYPELCEVVTDAWELYIKDMTWLMKTTMTKNISELANSKLIKKLLDTSYFNDNIKDGRSRLLFVLANVLKGEYDKKGLIELLQNWYRYTGGKKLTKGQVAYQVHAAYRSDQAPGEKYIRQLLLDLGVQKEEVDSI